MIFEPLDSQQIRLAIEPENLTSLAQLTIAETIDSTNSYLLKQAKLGAPSGTVCLAEQQTNGRGRLGRDWFSPPGANIYCSILWRFENKREDISALSLAVAVMLVSALRKYGIYAGIQLKWPNDVLVAGRKLAGILLERNDATGVVIGIGLNIDVRVAQEKTWIDLTEMTGQAISRNLLAGLLISELLVRLPIFATRGLTPFFNEWQQYDVLLNRVVEIHTPVKIFTGVVRGISEQGELVLEEQDGKLQQFRYGEVSVRF